MQTEMVAPPGNRPDLRRIGLHPDFWYPLARSSDIAPERTYAAMFAGNPIALARTARGQVFALDDRCAHRQFPLHKGVVTGETLRCAYHAWTYRTDGCLAGIPHLGKSQCRPQGVRAYPCREEDGYVFVFPGARDKAAVVPPPSRPLAASPHHRTMHFWRRIACHYSFMHENLMDMTHQFLHRGIMGKIRPTLLDYESGPDWVEVRYRFQDSRNSKPDWRSRLMLLADRHRRPPGAAAGPSGGGDIMTVRTQYPFQTLTLRRAHAERPSFHLWAAYVPYDRDQRSHVSVGALSIERPRIPGLMELAWPFIRRFAEAVFSEDRMAVEAEQRAYDSQGADWNQEVNPVILALRDVLIRNGVPSASSHVLDLPRQGP
jgi:phenylpropionate dioxygenase-like ring-hydroxylating dioxygenase large terminal subunit